MGSLISSFRQLLAKLFFRQYPPLSLQTSVSVQAMSTYSCTVSTKPGAAPEDSKLHHVKDQSGKLISFQNPFPSYGRWKDISLFKAGLIYFRYKAEGKLPVPDTSNAQIPTISPSFLPSRTGSSLRLTWLGHASYFVEFPSGFRALFDPVFEEKYSGMGPKRFTSPACKLGDFPALDAVFISHNHPDHLSYTSIKELVELYPRVHFFVGLRESKWYHDNGIKAVTEMDWWDDAEVVLERTMNPKVGSDDAESDVSTSPERISARVSFLPSQHGTMRTPLDFNKTLWGSWAITSGDKSMWFAGDTGYRCVPEGIEELGPGFDKLPRNPNFSQIGELRGPFDVGLIPIGAYAPRMMYSPVHASPYDAVEIFQDTKCKNAMAIHWGTWALTSEPVEEPPEKLKEALKIKGLAQTGLFDVCSIGESRDF
ncbi:N-acyl-phosphatidylethanolamine-hydrolyzing phospholipase D [Lachnellula cervina]|uniref:N-acyl-phosphatidylethanolamine-hydrolyzing phospholipase D n=1 Tax=Lachnellula cervina TaxID=1316786 RepID=A0A7D8UR18_9HELO|nr:N-acyl-phosphatidylethanolamine-hydrolyzing phospholipase D [Lachnellula cervina]